jgi:hypothetical protein
MPRLPKKFLVGCAVATVFVIVLLLAGPFAQRSMFYPKASTLPPAVSETSDQLIARLQKVLESNALAVAKSFQSGLSEAQISAFETKGGFHLSGDLRAMYRWRNGMNSTNSIGLLPGQRFLPLEEVVSELASVREQSGVAFKAFAGHRKGWLHILDDGAGDGYFWDPHRSDEEGAFFFYFAESNYYIWFPSVRNFLAGVIECYQTGAVKIASDGKSLDEDADRTGKIWSRLSKSNEG